MSTSLTAWRQVFAGVISGLAPPAPAVGRVAHYGELSGPVLVVAKSLGTLAAHWAAEQGYPGAWLTPVLRTAGLYQLPGHSDALAEQLRDYPAPSLVVGGTADVLWRNGFRGSGSVLEIEGADHGLEVADWRVSMRHHERVASAVLELAGSITR